MALPPAKKEASDHPASGSVVDPVNKEEKRADLDRKLRLYGVIQGFRQGKMPNNKQIDETLKYVIDHSLVDTSQLSHDGQKLIQDARDIIETARLIVVEKNADELFQNFVWHTQDVDLSEAKKDPNEILPVGKEKAKEDGRTAVRHLRTLLSLILTNSEVRKLFSDLTIIGRDLLARGTAKVAEGVRPDPEQLDRVDESAPKNQFVTENGQTVGSHDTPVPESRIPGTSVQVSQGTDANIANGDQIQSRDQAFQEGIGQSKKVVDDVVNGVQEATMDSDDKKRGFVDKVRDLRDNLTDKIPQEHRDKAQEHLERGKHFLAEEYFPEERRDQFIFRCKKVIIECQKHDDYQESLRWLLNFLGEYAAHGKSVIHEGKASQDKVASDPDLKQATKELRTLLERFANNQSLSPVVDAVNVLADDSKRDPELRQWFKDVDDYVRKVLFEPGYVLESTCNTQANTLRDAGQVFFDEKYRGHFDNVFSSVGDWFKAMGDDPLNVRFGEDWARLTRDLLFDSEGSLKFKTHLWNDIRKVILPTLVDKIGHIPIPRIEYTDDAIDLVVENLTLSGRNLFPNYVSLEAHNFIKFSPYNTIGDEHHHEFTLTFGQMQADMRDVAFYFKKKTGIPKMADSGLADILLGGEGLTATVHLVSAGKDKSSVFKLKHVAVKVATLKFSIRDSKHDLLYKTLKPLATGLVKRQIQKAIAGAIITGMEYVDGQLAAVRDRMKAAKATEGASRLQVLQDLFQRKQAEAQSVRSHDRGSQFKVVSNKRNSILATAGHPAGWVNRTAEKETAAAQGEGWHSEAFNIV